MYTTTAYLNNLEKFLVSNISDAWWPLTFGLTTKQIEVNTTNIYWLFSNLCPIVNILLAWGGGGVVKTLDKGKISGKSKMTAL